MKGKYSLLVALSLVSLISIPPLLARGGGGGGRGGGDRGGARSNLNASAYRSPSMSRANLDRGDFSRADVSRNLSNRDQLNDFLRSDTNLGVNRTALENAVGDTRLGDNGLFNRDFFNQHNLPYNYDRDLNLWRAADWNNLNGWLGWDAAAAYIDPSQTTTTVPVTTTATPTTTTSSEVAANTTTNSNLMPLGVFSMGGTAAQAANSSMYVQLAVDQSGNIQGVYYNTTTNQTQQVSGIADKTTQQAAWALSDKPNSPIMKTSLYNLTLNEFPVTVRFPDNGEQTWQLLRVTQQSS